VVVVMKKCVMKYVMVVMEKYAVAMKYTKLECVIKVNMTAWVVYREVVVYGYGSTEISLVHHYDLFCSSSKMNTTDSTCFVP
jgi:hypothetical protein